MSKSINQTITEPITIYTKLTSQLINKPQQPYPKSGKYEKIPVQDTVQIGEKESEQKWYQKYKKGLIAAGVGALAIGAAVFGHKKISAEQVKKAEEEARKLEQEAKQKAKQAAEHRAKLKESQRAYREGLHKKVKEDAIYHLKGAENTKAEFYSIPDILYRDLKDLSDAEMRRYFDENSKCVDFLMKLEKDTVNGPEDGVLDEIIATVSKLEKEKIDIEGIKEVLAAMPKASEHEISHIRQMGKLSSHPTEAIENWKRRNNDAIDGINKKLSTEPQREGESSTDYVKRLISDYKAETKALELQKIVSAAKEQGGIEIKNAVGYVCPDFEKSADEVKRAYNPDGTINFSILKSAAESGNKKCAYNVVRNMEFEMTRYSEADISQHIIDSVKKMEEAGVDYAGVKEVLGNAHLISDSDMKIIRQVGRMEKVDVISVEARLKASNEKMKYINEKLANETPEENETTTDFITRVIRDYENDKLAKRQQHLREVHSKIEYTDDPCVEYFADDPNYKGPNIGAAKRYSSFEGNSCGSPEEFREIFSSFPRYKSHEGSYASYDQAIREEYKGVKPLVRWMHTPNCEIDPATGGIIEETWGFRTSEEFVERFKVGEDYTIPTRQSCSKRYGMTEGDHNFCDEAIDKDIKFVFIPKSKNGSRAVDILEYGYKGHDCEAIYLPGERFTVLDKRLEEVVNQYKKPGDSCRSSYRWVIELQENPATEEVAKKADSSVASVAKTAAKEVSEAAPKAEMKPFNTAELYPESDKASLAELKKICEDLPYGTIEEKVTANGTQEDVMRIIKGTQSGSTMGSYAVSSDGTLYYLKNGNSAQNATEYAASQLYKAAGIAVPEVDLLTGQNYETMVRSKIIAGLNPHIAHKQALFDGFAMDAWLANWDAICSHNAQMKNGKAVRIDFGGTFNFRAQGGCKEFTSTVPEMHSILQFNDEYTGVKGMKREDLIKSLERVQSVSDADIEAVKKAVVGRMDTKLFDTLKERQQYLGKILEAAKTTPMEPNQSIIAYVMTLEEKVK